MRKNLSVIGLLFILMVVGCQKKQIDPYGELSTRITEETVQTTKDTIQTSQEVTQNTENEMNPVVLLPEYEKPEGVWYEIFVRSFADSDQDGIGDLQGITNQLGYLKELGISGIWLMPITESPSYHGYDVVDYYAIDEEYGTLEDFQELLKQAHEADIDVIMDLVINHTSSGHPWFLDAVQNVDSPYREYYHFIEKDTEGYNINQNVWGHRVWNATENGYYYGLFWDQMPDLNFENPAVRKEMIDIANFWMNLGIDGFRLDAAMHIYGEGETPKDVKGYTLNLQWWQEFEDALRATKEDVYIVGEVWSEIFMRSDYSGVFDSTFDFTLSEEGILPLVIAGEDFGSDGNGFNKMMEKTISKNQEEDPFFINIPFLSNHDQRRAMDYFDPEDSSSMKLAVNILMTLPGNPFIYYGEEIGMLGNKPDERIREPFLWGEEEIQTSWEGIDENVNTPPVIVQQADAESLLNHYKEIINLRNSQEVLTKGDFESVVTSSDFIIAYARNYNGKSMFAIHNVSKENQPFMMSELSSAVVKMIYSSEDFSFVGETEIIIPAQGTVIFEK